MTNQIQYMNQNETNDTFGQLKIVSHQDIADKYFSDKVKAFNKVYNTHEIIDEGEYKVVLKACYIGKVIIGEVTEKHIKKFCELINDEAERGNIEYGMLCPVSSFELARVQMPGHKEEKEKRHLLLFYPMSRKSFESLKEANKTNLYNTEGSLPTSTLEI